MRLSAASRHHLFHVCTRRRARPQVLPSFVRLFHKTVQHHYVGERHCNPMARPQPWIREMLGKSSFTGAQEAMYAAIRDDNIVELERLLAAGPPLHLAKAEGDSIDFGTAAAWSYPLHFAAYIGNLDAVRKLLDAGADPITCEEIVLTEEEDFEMTPLFLAIRSGHRAIVKALWEAGGAADSFVTETSARFSYLKLAAGAGHAAIVRDLLSWKQWDYEVKLSALREAAECWRFDVVDELLGPGSYFEHNDLFPALHTVLHDAVSSRKEYPREFLAQRTQLEYVEQQMIVHRLLDAGADPNSYVLGRPPLVNAATFGINCLGAVRTLLDNGANVDLADREGQTAFHLFVTSREWCSPAISLLLRRNANPNLKNCVGITALQLAAQHATEWSHLEPIMKTYVGEDSRVGNLDTDSGETLLHFAALGGKRETVEMLISAYNMDVNAETQTGWTPLMFALLPKSHLNHPTRSTLHAAVRTAKLLLLHGANPLTTTKEGWTPLHALSLHADEFPDGEAKALTSELISLGCSINPPPALALPPGWHAMPQRIHWPKGPWKKLPLLHWAASHGAVEVMEALIENGADVLEEDMYNNTAREVVETSGHVGWPEPSCNGPSRNLNAVGQMMLKVLDEARDKR